ncbi:hypothetical protein [Microcystis phage Mvi-JY20]|uniref:Uncharacterized protein n=1 Tax=Microcystis phage Mvi-JY20 TaxID=3128146 RepID=A0AAX4QH51_9CAUD
MATKKLHRYKDPATGLALNPTDALQALDPLTELPTEYFLTLLARKYLRKQHATPETLTEACKNYRKALTLTQADNFHPYALTLKNLHPSR